MKKLSVSFAVLAALAPMTWGAPAIHSNLLETVQGLFEAKKYGQVIENLPDQNIENLSHDEQPQAYLLLGLSYSRQGEIDKALGVLQLAAQLFPDNINVLSQLADLLHNEELSDRAKPLYERILRIHPNNNAAHLKLAEIEHSQGFLERSIDHYERCLTEYSKAPEVWRAYAMVLSERGDYPKAVTAIEKSLNLDPHNAQSLESLAVFQYRQGLYSRADETIRKAIAYAEIKTPLLLEHALWLLDENKLDASLRETQQALQKYPNNPLGRWIRASIFLRHGDKKNAIQDLRLVASTNERFPLIASVAQGMLERLEAQQ